MTNNIDIRLGSYATALDDVQANLIFTSPPYNIGSKSPRIAGKRHAGIMDPKSYGAITDYPDNLPEIEYQDGQADMMIWAADHLAEGGVLAYNHKPRRRNMAIIHPASWFLRPEVTRKLVLMEEIVWDRGSTHNHSNRMMWNRTERIYVFRRADDAPSTYPLINDRSTSLAQRHDSWHIKLSASSTVAIGHNAPFHVELGEAVIQAWSKPGDLVCDPYTGSGSTAIAAANLDRRFVGSELMPKYHKLAVERVNTEAVQLALETETAA
jgi:site-specific DNA-methyltransferase (adenine-specific)